MELRENRFFTIDNRQTVTFNVPDKEGQQSVELTFTFNMPFGSPWEACQNALIAIAQELKALEIKAQGPAKEPEVTDELE